MYIKKIEYIVLLLILFFSFFILNGENLYTKNRKIERSNFYSLILKRLTLKYEDSKQVIIVTNKKSHSYLTTFHTFEKKQGHWIRVFQCMKATIGINGFAEPDAKREGDKKTPSGIFLLGTAFGYDRTCKTKMNYRMAEKNDFWVDDVDSDQYNIWIRGKPQAFSYEKMKRIDNLYKYGIVVEYNINPIIKGMGSAIFIHVWRKLNLPTLGCISLSEKNIKRVLQWLDSGKKPIIILGNRNILKIL